MTPRGRLVKEQSTEDTQKYQEETYPETVVPQHIQEENEKTSEEATPTEVNTVYTGQCVGGPLDGMGAVSRYPKGFVLVDIPNQVCWVYDSVALLDEGQAFHCRPRDHWDTQRGEKAAQESNYDVRAFDAETMKGPRGYDGEPHSR